MFKKLFIGLGAVVVAGLAYLLAWPVPIAPVAWQAPPAPGYQGPCRGPAAPLARLHPP